MDPYKTISLENNQTLVIWDLSRRIAADAQVVIMEATMDIAITKDLFQVERVDSTQLVDMQKVLGDQITYSYRVERNMIMDTDKEAVLATLVDTFLANTGQYVQRPQFPEKLVLKEYRERIDKKRLPV